jgi:MFS transporter, putative metabolite:H+ symporter
MQKQSNSNTVSIFNIAVFVAALGYFVDIYDLLLFTIVKKTSLLAVGSTDTSLLADSTRVLNWQMYGLLLGGIFWGVLGDKKGRLSVLFGSIILYSIANFFTAYVHTVDHYALCRFIAGLGLAGELGAGITLVSELLPKAKRGIGTSLVSCIGLLGAIAAFYTFKLTKDWRTCYIVGGALGVLLLFLRIKVAESGMFKTVKEQNVSKGNFFMFFTNAKRFKKYILAILIGLPTWYAIGIIVNQSDHFGKELFGSTTINSGEAIMFAYAGLSIGGIAIGLVSQYFQSRKIALLIFYSLFIISLILFFSPYNNTDTSMYVICTALGFSTGLWAIFVTMGAEQFGTNLRATAATTIPNMVRGALPLITMLFLYLYKNAPKDQAMPLSRSGIITGVVVTSITLIALFFTEETFHKDLDYIEEP